MSEPHSSAPGPTPPGGTPPGSPAPGWYQDPSGQTRWWDGTTWGDAAAPSQLPATAYSPTGVGGSVQDQTSTAMLAQILGLIGVVAAGFGWIGPLIIYLTARPDQTFVKHHAAESLNFQLTLLIAWIVSFVLMFVLVGFLTAIVVWIVSIVFPILAAVAANKGEWYRYPINIRFVKGAVG